MLPGFGRKGDVSLDLLRHLVAPLGVPDLITGLAMARAFSNGTEDVGCLLRNVTLSGGFDPTCTSTTATKQCRRPPFQTMIQVDQLYTYAGHTGR